MLASASAGFVVSVITENWFLGFLTASLVGLLFGLLLAFIHEKFKVNQFIIGITLVILGAGLSDLIYKVVVGIQLFIPQAPSVPKVELPYLPLISPFINQNIIVYLTYLLVFITYVVMYKTRIGLELRSVGEDPKAADVVGINVTLVRYVATMIGASLMGLAGAYLPIVITGTYTPNMTNGRGFIAIGIAIFASWRPERTFLGALLFSSIEAVALQLQLSSSLIPYQFLLATPFIALLIVMWIFKKKVEFPASIGKPYSRE